MEVGEKNESRHGIEFFSRGADGRIEMTPQFADRHQDEDDMSKDGLPAGIDDLASDFGDEPMKRVEEAVLLGIDDIPHLSRNSLSGMIVKYRKATANVKWKNGVNYDILRGCDELSG